MYFMFKVHFDSFHVEVILCHFLTLRSASYTSICLSVLPYGPPTIVGRSYGIGPIVSWLVSWLAVFLKNRSKDFLYFGPPTIVGSGSYKIAPVIIISSYSFSTVFLSNGSKDFAHFWPDVR